MDIYPPVANSTSTSANSTMSFRDGEDIGDIEMNEREQKQGGDFPGLIQRSNSLPSLLPPRSHSLTLRTSNPTNLKVKRRQSSSNSSSTSKKTSNPMFSKNNKIRKTPRANPRKSKNVRDAEKLAAAAAVVSMGTSTGEAELVAGFKGVGLRHGTDEGEFEAFKLYNRFSVGEVGGMLQKGMERKRSVGGWVGEEGVCEGQFEVEVGGKGEEGMECDG